MNNIIEVHRMVGDRLTPIAGQLYQGGAPVNLTGLTVVFRMINNAGDVIVDDEAATIDVAASGKVSFGLSADDVDEAGTFWMWFIVVGAGSKEDSFPCDGRKFKLVIHEDTET